MRVMLRCEVDACFAVEAASQASQSDIKGSKSNTADDLADAFSALKVTIQEDSDQSTSASPLPDHSRNDVVVIKGGVEVPQSSLIKIKTRSARNAETFDWTAAYIQLFIGQTSNLFTGIHRSGTFNEIQQKQLDSPEFGAASKRAQGALKKLRRLLDEICYIVMHHDTTGRLSLVCQRDELKIYERASQDSILPDDILERF